MELAATVAERCGRAVVIEHSGDVYACDHCVYPEYRLGNISADNLLQMMQWTAAGKGARFCLYVHHTDADHEWAYDRTSSVGRLDKALDEARAKGWTIVDMKNDWKIIYPFEKK